MMPFGPGALILAEYNLFIRGDYMKHYGSLTCLYFDQFFLDFLIYFVVIKILGSEGEYILSTDEPNPSAT